MEYRRSLPKLLKHATPAEKKELIRAWVEDIRLTPEQLEVTITYQIPEPVVNKLVAGARYKAIHDTIGSVLGRTLELPRNGRRPPGAGAFFVDSRTPS